MSKPTLVTTAIAYVNGVPHIGHLYEILLGDMINRFLNLTGDSELLTGTDEHGKKIQSTADNLGIDTKQFCDINSTKFKELYNELQIIYSRFIRTSDEDHIQLVKEAIEICKCDIFKTQYSGYYNIREETFISNKDAASTDYKDPLTGIKYDYLSEETYMFALSLYVNVIKENLHKVTGFNIDTFTERLNNLQELSITRIKKDSFNWGIDFPIDEKHIVYVWFDALLNYITGSKSIFGNTEHKTIHVIGKDIVWFHAVIYPAILSSLNLPLYDRIYVHGFILDQNGNKMSKSFGNVIEPKVLLDKYPIEAIRFYFFMETHMGNDILFSSSNLVAYYNNILVKEFGNLLQRYHKLLATFEAVQNHPFTLHNDVINATKIVDFYELRSIFRKILSFANKELTDCKPWDKNVDIVDRYNCMLNVGCAVYNLMEILKCVIPNKIQELNKVIGLPLTPLSMRDNYQSFDGVYTYLEKFQAFVMIK